MIVEDDPSSADSIALTFELGFKGVVVEQYDRVRSALEAFERFQPDLVTADLGLPDADGNQLIRYLRTKSDVPIIVLSARDDDSSILTAVRLGADDYIVKPFSSIELQAHVEALLRRASGGKPSQVDIVRLSPDMTLDLARAVVIQGDGEVELSAREFECLKVLVEAEGRIVSTRELKTSVWRTDTVSDSAVKMVFYRLRQTLGDHEQSRTLIQSHRGIGYSVNLG